MLLADSIAQKNKSNQLPNNPAGKNDKGQKDPTIAAF